MINAWTLHIIKTIDNKQVKKLFNFTPLLIPNIWLKAAFKESKKYKSYDYFRMAYKDDAEHDFAKNVPILTGFDLNTECLFLKICFKVTFETMTYTYIKINNKYICHYTLWSWVFISLSGCYCFNEILGISDLIFLLVIIGWIRLVKGSKSSG